MTWLLWRQHRLQGAVAGGAYAAFLVLLLLTGWHMADLYRSALATCRANRTCDDLNLFQGYGAIVDTVNLSVAVPLIIGAFWGATLVGREYDAGTQALVWTQSITRRRWLRDKIMLLFAATFVCSAAMAAIVTWWSGTTNSLYGDRFTPSKFDVQGFVPVAFAVFAAALGLAAGAITRRILPALAITVIGFAAVRIAVTNFARPHYLAPLVSDTPFGQLEPVPSGSWQIKQSIELHGQVLSGAIRLPAECAGATVRAGARECLGNLGYRYVVRYQPASRYWTFQLIESALYVGLAAGLVTVAVVAVRRRDA